LGDGQGLETRVREGRLHYRYFRIRRGGGKEGEGYPHFTSFNRNKKKSEKGEGLSGERGGEKLFRTTTIFEEVKGSYFFYEMQTGKGNKKGNES